ncbi:hypothetical protein [uncultured Arcticibacterium sp.]|uniref:hypothetical protein n=1 Tax=uncultured Arcticibacterium sp. TaxID=2173042 RepID=UPI0030F85D46
MKRNLGLFTFAVSSLLSVASMAQDTGSDNHTITVKVPEVAILDLHSSESALDFDASFVQTSPLEAGTKITDAEDNSNTWLNYSSILKDGGVESRHIDVKASEVVPGIAIKVTAGSATGGKGTLGGSDGTVTLTVEDQSIVSAIGSAYTEDGPNKGHQLTYVFEALDDNYGDLLAKDYAVQVTYTLADN